MTFAELQAEIARWTFMPGWTFEVRRRFDHDEATLDVYSDVPDAYHPERVVLVRGTFPVPWLSHFEIQEVGEWLRQCVHFRMMHEADEWLRRDGEVPFDPHARTRKITR